MRLRLSFLIAAFFFASSVTSGRAQEASIMGVFCDTAEQIETYIQQQQSGKTSNEAFEEVLKQDAQHTCGNGNMTIDHIHQVGGLYQLLGKTVGIFAIRIVAVPPVSGQSEPPYRRLNPPMDAYTPIAVR
jgi:hypothetical protein